ncbi:MAG: glycosyltransferase family 39 protein [Anaerolineae bacterium]|nr:glycosyltransferase family 39 protein [Anaerolineae bacterium]
MDWPWLLGALLVAVALRAFNLEGQSLRMDEGATYLRLTLPPGVVIENILSIRNQTPFYYLVARLWVAVAGTSEYAMRFPSSFFSVLNMAVLYHLGRAGGSRLVGRTVVWLNALSPFDIYFASDARMYAVALVFITANMLIFYRMVSGKGRRSCWIIFAVTAALMYITHYFTLFIAFVQLVFFLFSFRRMHRRFRGWVVAQAAACVPAGAWALASYWYCGFFGFRTMSPLPTWLTPLRTFWNLSLGYDGHLTPYVAAGLVAWVLAFAVGMIWRRGVAREWHRLMIMWLVLPPATVFVLAFVRRPVYIDRYFSICLPAFLVLVAHGVLTFPRRWLRVGLAALLVTATFASAVGVLCGERLTKPDWRSAIQHILDHHQADDRLAIQGLGLAVTHYYAPDVLPIELMDGPDMSELLTDALAREGRLWFLYRDPLRTNHKLDEAVPFDPYETGDPKVADWLRTHSAYIVGEWYWDGLYLVLLDPAKD